MISYLTKVTKKRVNYGYKKKHPEDLRENKILNLAKREVPGFEELLDRFVLRYTNKSLANNNFDSLENKVLVSKKYKKIQINSFDETIDKVTIYDLLGKQIYQKEKVNSNELSIADLASSHQPLIVKTVLQNGRSVTDKIIY